MILYDLAGAEVARLKDNMATYMVVGDGLPIVAVKVIGAVKPPGKSKNAGGHLVAIADIVDVDIKLIGKEDVQTTRYPVDRTSIADGAWADYEVTVRPADAVMNVDIKAVQIKHDDPIENLAKRKSDFVQFAMPNDFLWRLQNARWIQPKEDRCHDLSFQDLEIVWTYRKLPNQNAAPFIKPRPSFVSIDGRYGDNKSEIDTKDLTLIVPQNVQHNTTISSDLLNGSVAVQEANGTFFFDVKDIKLTLDIRASSTVEVHRIRPVSVSL